MKKDIKSYLLYSLIYNMVFVVLLSGVVYVRNNTLFLGIMMINGLIVTFLILGFDLIDPTIEDLIERVKKVHKKK